MSVHLVHGDKGGVGKSLLASVLVEYVLARKCNAFVVDADMRNADLFAAFQHTDVPTARVDVRTQDGWMELATILERTQDAEVVISLPAGVGNEVTENEHFLREALEGLERSLVCFWVLNRSPHSIALLRPFLERYGGFARAMVAVRNLYFGGPERFTRWKEAKTREAFTAAGGLEMDLEDLSDRIVDATFLHLPPRRFSDGAALSYGERLGLRRWLDHTFAAFDGLGDRLGVGTR